MKKRNGNEDTIITIRPIPRNHFPAHQDTSIPCLAAGGMFSTTDNEWTPLRDSLANAGYSLLHKDLVGHGTNIPWNLHCVNFSDCVRDMALSLDCLHKAKQRRVVLIGHSLGAAVMITLASKFYDMVRCVVAINPPPLSIAPSLIPKYLHLNYLKAAISSETFSLRPEEQKLVQDGSDIPLGPESGKILREVAFGLKVPRLGDLNCHSILVCSVDDGLVPWNHTSENIKYHAHNARVEVVISPIGGHFCHYHPTSQRLVSSKIIQALKASEFKSVAST